MLPIIISLKAFVRRFGADEEGAAAVEYAIIVGLMALAVSAGATALGGGVETLFGNIVTMLEGIDLSGGE